MTDLQKTAACRFPLLSVFSRCHTDPFSLIRHVKDFKPGSLYRIGHSLFFIVNNTVEKRASYDHNRIIEKFGTGDKKLINEVLKDHSMVMKQILLEKLLEA